MIQQLFIGKEELPKPWARFPHAKVIITRRIYVEPDKFDLQTLFRLFAQERGIYLVKIGDLCPNCGVGKIVFRQRYIWNGHYLREV